MLLRRSMLRPLPLLARASCLARPMATSPKTALIKELRARTSAPMKKCVDALAAAEGDLDAAVDWLRKSGVATAHKKAGRGANEGAVVVASDETGCVIVELNSETDFVRHTGLEPVARQAHTCESHTCLLVWGSSPVLTRLDRLDRCANPRRADSRQVCHSHA